jgi:mannose-6-phosphate isomerase-like protein (cupin superfamily)
VTDPYTILRAADAPDYTGDAPGAFHGYARPMGAEQIGFNLRVLEPGTVHMPPGGDPRAGHSHATIEEIYFVLEGEITAKLGEDVVTLGRWDAVLIPPDTPRSVRNDSPERAAIAMVSVKVTDHASESLPVESFWP